MKHLLFKLFLQFTMTVPMTVVLLYATGGESYMVRLACWVTAWLVAGCILDVAELTVRVRKGENQHETGR